jgi:hypothetical protein
MDNSRLVSPASLLGVSTETTLENSDGWIESDSTQMDSAVDKEMEKFLGKFYDTTP